MAHLSLKSIVDVVGGHIEGDPSFVVDSINTLNNAEGSCLSFFANRRYLSQLSETSAGAVLVKAEYAEYAPCHKIVVEDPYLAYATLSHYFLSDYRQKVSTPLASPIVHSTAVLADDVT
ncbi:MAG: LpxD N-terminal domain-containing protein, partial [Pontibacterium sp.]